MKTGQENLFFRLNMQYILPELTRNIMFKRTEDFLNLSKED